MIFSDRQIKQAIADGRIVIEPAPLEDQFAPSAIDLHVGDQFKIWKTPPPGLDQTLRLSDVCLPDYGHLMTQLEPDDEGCAVIAPGQFVLSSTREKVHLPLNSRLAARVEGRSSYARLGLVVHMTAPTIHAGFRGRIVLEMMNFGPFPLRIDPGTTRICQLIFEELGSDPSIALETVFQDQSDVLGEKEQSDTRDC